MWVQWEFTESLWVARGGVGRRRRLLLYPLYSGGRTVNIVLARAQQKVEQNTVVDYVQICGLASYVFAVVGTYLPIQRRALI